MVWYQKFEYAIGHWLQKAAEHMLGCVLCSPGCFSLFRGSAIMDDNVMRTYATKSTEARHYVQYDQGWYLTLYRYNVIKLPSVCLPSNCWLFKISSEYAGLKS